mmetsp:Transcript_21259/g.69636  ORF Transcript_21259/g.69636 Transcript_21259/m.69636 type:complete len:249 (-) Transcript_21259:1116-1862(-)
MMRSRHASSSATAEKCGARATHAGSSAATAGRCCCSASCTLSLPRAIASVSASTSASRSTPSSPMIASNARSSASASRARAAKWPSQARSQARARIWGGKRGCDLGDHSHASTSSAAAAVTCASSTRPSTALRLPGSDQLSACDGHSAPTRLPASHARASAIGVAWQSRRASLQRRGSSRVANTSAPSRSRARVRASGATGQKCSGETQSDVSSMKSRMPQSTNSATEASWSTSIVSSSPPDSASGTL